MKNSLRSLLFLFGMVTSLLSHTQQIYNLKLMSHNMLNFPTGNIPGRIDTLKKIVAYVQPDLLMIQELKTAQGLNDIASMMNTLGYGDFTTSQFVPQQSNPGTSFPLQQAIVFNQEKLKLKSQSEITTEVRDINEFVLYLNDAGLPAGSDTTFIYVYVTHLKSSEGAENVALRLSMVNDWLEHMNANFSGNENVIIAGDFNFYTNSEPAYLALTNEENTVVMRDVFDSYGNWTGSSFAHKEILTQSTRSSQLAGDGAGGGVDDRFDFILFSEAMMNAGNTIYVEEGSYTSLGNTGNCYNQNITDCDQDNDVPYDVLRAIYYMSDHIPQVCNLEVQLDLAVNDAPKDLENFHANYQTGNLTVNFNAYRSTPLSIRLLDMNGHCLMIKDVRAVTGKNQFRWETSALPQGMYLVTVHTHAGYVRTQKLVVMP